MRHTKQIGRLLGYGMSAYAILALLYLLLIIVLPANRHSMQAYNLTASGYHIIQLMIAVPALVVWFLGFLSYTRLESYAVAIRKSNEGEHFARLAKGAGWLAWSLPVAAITTLTLDSLTNKWPGFHRTATIISSYVNLLLPLIAFTVISAAARGLFAQANLRYRLAGSRLISLLFMAGGVLYCYLIFRRLDLHSLSSADNPYFLPIWLLVLTIIIPALYAWFMGILAIYEISLYGKAVPGVFYRQALNLLVSGLALVILSLIARQYMSGVSPHTGYLVIDYKLAILLLLRVVSGAGFALMAWGALKLRKIEEV